MCWVLRVLGVMETWRLPQIGHSPQTGPFDGLWSVLGRVTQEPHGNLNKGPLRYVDWGTGNKDLLRVGGH